MSETSSVVRLRLADSADEDLLAQLFASTRPEFDLLPDSQKQALVNMQFNAQRQQYGASYPDAKNSLILLHDQAIGRMLVDRGAREFTLIDIALFPAHRNAGIGTGLIQQLLREARVAGKSVRLHVAKLSPAQRLYERLGFSRVGDQSMYYEMLYI
jgi:ribosomal protein S18 acetylase RimI-like enzyme